VAANDASAVYLWDQDLGITWLRNANINGIANWTTQNNFAQTLVTGAGANAISNWRLPTVTDYNSDGCTTFSFAGGAGTDCGSNVDTSGSEMAHLYYVTLGNLAYCPAGDVTCAGGPQVGFGLTNVGDFLNMQSTIYWSGTDYAPIPGYAWLLLTVGGSQGNAAKVNGSLYAVAVRPGDVAAIPEPQTYAMLLAGLGAVGVAVRRRRPR